MTDIEKVRACVEHIEHELYTLKNLLHRLQITLTGVAIGDVVRGKGRYEGTVFRVMEHNAVGADGRYRWLSGNPQRADGSFGIEVCNLYDQWESIAP